MNLDHSLAERDASLLVLAPHPDDESLATGGLIQRALERRARVRIAWITDGDNNPWPQRALERRVRIGASQRVAWGIRRRGEAQHALRGLGAQDVATQRLGWPDGGVTWKLIGETAQAIASLRTLIEDARPTLLVLPDLADGHPDHSALHVLVELVLNGMPMERRPQCLCYLLHGRAPNDAPSRIVLKLTPQEQARKRVAICAHKSQIALSRGRMLRNAGAFEYFAPGVGNHALSGPRLPWQPPRWLIPSMVLLAVDAQGGQRLTRCRDPRQANLCWRDGSPAAHAARAPQPPYYVKLYAELPSPWVFDHWGWRRFIA
ncbi:MAG: PIG-L family deacetylase [Rhodanobacteraceae bacterium]